MQDTNSFPGNYAKLPPPVMMRTDAVEMIVEWLGERVQQRSFIRFLIALWLLV